jgi:hypothetical protein
MMIENRAVAVFLITPLRRPAEVRSCGAAFARWQQATCARYGSVDITTEIHPRRS